MAATSLADRLRARIAANGPIAVSDFVDAALYDEAEGFYAAGGQAGRRGDFITAPEVGPLFGAVVSNAVDAWWREAGEPGRFVVAEHGAGPGTLARTVTAAGGACLGSGALEWVMVERSDSQRLRHPEGDHLRSVVDDGSLDRVDVVFANELLDNLAFDIVQCGDSGWFELRVGTDDTGFALVGGSPAATPAGVDDAPAGSVLPVIGPATDWVRERRRRFPEALVVVLDYAAATSVLLERDGEWLRAYRSHDRVADWLADPGRCDITIDLPTEQLAAIGSPIIETQAAFLRRHGIDVLVEEGRRAWEASAHVGDLAALRARSRLTEAGALLDPAGMGSFLVVSWPSQEPQLADGTPTRPTLSE